MNSRITNVLEQSIAVKQAILQQNDLLQRIDTAAEMMIRAFRNDAKVWLCGNGGSAADAQHIAAELSGRFYLNRPGLFAEALGVNFSYLTAVANDFGYDAVFERLIQAVGRPNDILIAISTSGNSPNVLAAAQYAYQHGLQVIALTGETGGSLAQCCHCLLNVPSHATPRIQEVHITIGHILCEIVESSLFPT